MMNVALVLSGGTGTRLGRDIPKQYWTIAGKPVIVHTLEQFEAFEAVAGVIVVEAPDWAGRILEWKEAYGLSRLWDIAPAGADRQQSKRTAWISRSSPANVNGAPRGAGRRERCYWRNNSGKRRTGHRSGRGYEREPGGHGVPRRL